MRNPDVVTQNSLKLDLKTVNVESKVKHTNWTVEIGDFIIYHDPSLDRFFNKVIKTSNVIHRLKRKKDKSTLESQLHILSILSDETV